MSIVKVEIQNWIKFNPRSDRANYTWFRLQNDFFHDQRVFGLTDSQRCLYLFVLCECSKKNTGIIGLLPGYVSAILGRRESEIIKDFQRLVDVGIMTAESRLNDGKEPTNIPATYERTNVHNEVTNDACGAELDFESLYQKYPRKLGKQKGIERCRKLIKTPEDFSALSIAIDRYRKYILAQGTEAQFIKHFSSFMGEWRDWLDDQTGTHSSRKTINTTPIKLEEIA